MFDQFLVRQGKVLIVIVRCGVHATYVSRRELDDWSESRCIDVGNRTLTERTAGYPRTPFVLGVFYIFRSGQRNLPATFGGKKGENLGP